MMTIINMIIIIMLTLVTSCKGTRAVWRAACGFSSKIAPSAAMLNRL